MAFAHCKLHSTAFLVEKGCPFCAREAPDTTPPAEQPTLDDVRDWLRSVDEFPRDEVVGALLDCVSVLRRVAAEQQRDLESMRALIELDPTAPSADPGTAHDGTSTATPTAEAPSSHDKLDRQLEQPSSGSAVSKPSGEWRAPRRICVDRMTPAELAIHSAVEAVESAGCDTRLTEAVNLLHAAREKVADFVDGVAPALPRPASGTDSSGAASRIRASFAPAISLLGALVLELEGWSDPLVRAFAVDVAEIRERLARVGEKCETGVGRG